MHANVKFKGYEWNDRTNKPLINFELYAIDINKIDLICESIQKAYEFGNPISWSIEIDHEYI
jgi:hypothetical protein